ncbi:MAG: DNA repair protein RadC [Bacteroidales bacterium]|nr:DNA repair protein RadC [Bacteroidales bacterium]
MEAEIEKNSLAGTRTLKLHTAEDDRPREKALKHGFDALSNAELMAIVIGSGTPGESVVDLCQRILNDNGQKLGEIARMGVKGLTKYKGIGPVKAIELMAALQLSRRYQKERLQEVVITSSDDAYNYLRNEMEHLEHEEIWIMMLNRAKKVIACKRMSMGGTTAAVGDIKMILRELIDRLADGVILAHNHPSDNPRPSTQDDNLTERLQAACRAVDVQMLDHIIVCRGGKYYSYLDSGRM